MGDRKADTPPHRNESSEPSLELRFRQAAEAHRRGQRDGVEEIYREMLSQNPDHFHALNSMGVLALHRDKRDLASDLLEGTEAAARLTEEALLDLIRA